MEAMPVKFASTKFGSVTVNGQEYKDILVVGEKIIPRDLDMLHQEYGTGHVVAPEELDRLLSGEPDVVVIGTGQYGLLKVGESIREMAGEVGVDLIFASTPKAISRYNQLVEEGKKVNALIHVTC